MLKKLSLFLTLASLLAFQAPALAQTTTELPEEIVNMKSEGFTIVPSKPNAINARKFIFELKPGTNVRDSVVVKNLSDEEATFFVYGADPTLSSQGTLAYKTRDAGGDGEGQWIQFDEPQVVLGPEEEKVLQFTLTVPEETPYGDYRAGIAMEKTKKDANNPNVTIATRLILHSDIKVTDNPNPVPGQGSTTETTAPKDKGSLELYYFWISLALFIASFIALVWITFQEKKSPVETFSTSAAAGGSTKTSAAGKKSARRKPSAKTKKSTNRASTTRKSTAKKPAKKRTTKKKK